MKPGRASRRRQENRCRQVSRRRQENRRALAIITASTAAILLLASALLWLKPTTTPTASASPIGGPFTLVADDGTQVTDHSFPGKYLLVYFGYTTCRDVCPATLNSLAAALDHLGGQASRVQPLFITIDPARDTPAALHRYVRAFTPRLIGLTGPLTALQHVADEYRVTRAPRNDALDHSAVVYLMAPDGSFIAPIPSDATETIMTRTIARYIAS